MESYILTWRPDKFWLIGPFADHDAAFEWTTSESSNPDDNPNWWIVAVAEPNAPVEVVPPTEPLADWDVRDFPEAVPPTSQVSSQP
jgi:hypothetical protein